MHRCICLFLLTQEHTHKHTNAYRHGNVYTHTVYDDLKVART